MVKSPNFAFVRQLRKILFPFSILYDIITRLRNWMYDNGTLSSTEFDIPVLCVGNLSVGGTGKSPMVEYLVRLLQNKQKVAVLSRGYGRKTKGFQWVHSDDASAAVGDEPLQIKQKFPEALVAVCEDRVLGIKSILEHTAVDMVLLDDAFQHRRVKPSFNILLTAFDDLYANDLLLPAGNLRESRSGAKRANVVVVTKCPSSISVEERQSIKQRLALRNTQELFFSTISYSEKVYGENHQISVSELMDTSVLLVTGIAKPQPLVDYLFQKGIEVDHLAFKDHHHFSRQDMMKIIESAQKRLILTTEKDFVRLKPLMEGKRLYYLPIAHQFIEEKELFDDMILTQRKKA